MNDDKPHEHVSDVEIAHEVAEAQAEVTRATRAEAMALDRLAHVRNLHQQVIRELRAEQGRVADLEAERNNMAEAARQINARLVEVTKECEELRAALAHAVLSPQQRMVALGARLSAMEDDRR